MIENFALSSKALYGMLKKKGVEYLYHANTVATSLTFIKAKCLLSRHQVNSDGLNQSYQKSDGHDKLHDVWDHIYVDGTDHHTIYSRSNFYGPVLFRFSVDILTSPAFKDIFIMKSNPYYWNKKMTLEDKFYLNIDDVNRDYMTGKRLDSQIMFTFRNPKRELKLNKFLHSIYIDEPSVLIKLRSGGEMLAGSYIRTVIGDSLDGNGLSHIPLLKRHENPLSFCKCAAQYTYMYNFEPDEFKRRFSRNAI